ncbi:hypothetical protein AMK09_06450 [Streptomyces sp. CB02488]|nr:hypothetical protein AMK09_06450 [Streptomyces sp. CB02488]
MFCMIPGSAFRASSAAGPAGSRPGCATRADDLLASPDGLAAAADDLPVPHRRTLSASPDGGVWRGFPYPAPGSRSLPERV